MGLLDPGKDATSVTNLLVAIANIALYLYLGYLCYSLIAPAFGLPTLSFVQTTAGMILAAIAGRLLFKS